MTITGLENNYYLAGNDIWVAVSDFPKTPVRLELKATNTDTAKTLPVFRLYADLSNIFRFNLSQTVRPLQPYPDHTANNSLQTYEFEFLVSFDDNTFETLTLQKYFLRGGRVKKGADVWYLQNGAPLLTTKWVDWRGIILPGYAQKIQNQLIVDYIPAGADTLKMILPNSCNAKIIKFLNSLGGYQYWIFESSEISKKVKAKDVISIIPTALKSDIFRNTGTESEAEITLKTKTPAELQPLILELIESPEILMYDSSGTDDESRWQRLQHPNSNDALINTNDMSYLNEINFTLPNYINRDL